MTCTATFYDITCNRNTPCVGHRHSWTDDEPWFAEWGDDTPGATPHVEPEPAVTHHEVNEAWNAWETSVHGDPTGASAMRAALAAAFAIHDEDRPDVNNNPLHDWHWCIDEQEVHHVADVCTYPQGRHDLYVTRFPTDKEQTDD